MSTELHNSEMPRIRVTRLEDGADCPHLKAKFRRKFPMVVGQLRTGYPQDVTFSGVQYRISQA